MTTARPVHRIGDVPRQNNAFFLGARIWNGHRRKQGLRVGVFRLRVQLTRRRNFYNTAQIHHSNAIADVLDHRQVVGNEQISQTHLGL